MLKSLTEFDQNLRNGILQIKKEVKYLSVHINPDYSDTNKRSVTKKL